MNTRKIVPLVSLAAAGLAGGAYWKIAHHGGGQATTAGAQVVTTTAAQVPRARLGCAIPENETLAYRLSLDVSGEVHAAALGAAGRNDAQITRAVRGTLELRSLTATSENSTLLARFYGLTMDGVPAGLDAPFLLRIGSHCEVEGFARELSTPVLTARTQQSFAHELLWRMPDALSSEAQGENAIGRYAASYDKLEDGNIRGKINTYTKIWADDRSGVAPKVSSVDVAVGARSWFTSLRRHEVLKGLSAADSDTSVQADRVDASPGAFEGVSLDVSKYAWQNLLPRANATARAGRSVTKADRKAREEVKDLPVAEALKRHVEFVAKTTNFAEMWPPLSTYLEARPEMTGDVVDALRGNIVPEGVAPAWVAVGQARTPQAREALLAVIRSGSAPSIDRTRAMFAMMDRDDLGVEFARELGVFAAQMHRSGNDWETQAFAREAALGLGMFANLRMESDRKVFDVAHESLAELLANQTLPANFHPIFAAIGNLGDHRMVDLARPYFSHPEPKVRAASAQVFRRLEPESHTAVIAEWLIREVDPTVKRAIYQTLEKETLDAQRPYEPLILDRAAADLPMMKSLLTRKAIVKVLGPGAKDYAPARQALIAQAKTEFQKRTNLFKVISPYLTPAEVTFALGKASQ